MGRKENRAVGIFIKTCLLMWCMGASFLLFAQQKKAAVDLLYWKKGSSLSLTDFRAAYKPDTSSKKLNSGTTHRLGVIATAIDVHVKTERGRTTFTIRAVMNRNRSWIRNSGDTVSLKHEQGHFDICEIYTRIMRRELRKAKSIAQSRAIYESILKAETAEHDAFDKVNTFENGGIDKAWADKIARRLKELEGYANPVVVLPFDK